MAVAGAARHAVVMYRRRLFGLLVFRVLIRMSGLCEGGFVLGVRVSVGVETADDSQVSSSSRAYMDRGVGLCLDDLDQPFLHELEDGDESDRDAHATFLGAKQPREVDEGHLSEIAQDVG